MVIVMRLACTWATDVPLILPPANVRCAGRGTTAVGTTGCTDRFSASSCKKNKLHGIKRHEQPHYETTMVVDGTNRRVYAVGRQQVEVVTLRGICCNFSHECIVKTHKDNIHTHIYKHTYKSTHVHMYTHIHIYTYTHTYTHTHLRQIYKTRMRGGFLHEGQERFQLHELAPPHVPRWC